MCSLNGKRSGRCVRKNASPQERESSSAVHLTLEGLETIDLSLHLSIAPGSLDRCQNGGEVLLKAKGKPDHRSDAALLGVLNPPQHLPIIFAGQRLAELKR
jgi:hypothetical protein